MQPTTNKHIECRPDTCGGKPCISGTRIRVWDVHVWHDLRGQSVEEIVAAYPQISLADVHAAMAYYFDHREEIERQMGEATASVARLEAEQGPTRFSRLRDEILSGKDGHGNPISSG